VEDLERRLAAERPAINDRIVALYTAGDIAAPWRWPDAATLQDAARAQRLLAAVSAEDRARLHAYLADVRHLGEARTRLAARLKEAADWQARAATARDAASRAAAEQVAQVGAVAERRDLAERLAGELRQAQHALETTVSGLPAAAMPTVPRAVLPVRAFRGALPWPVPGPLVSRFGRETQSRFGTGLVRNGIEIGAAGQTAVAAVHGGRVAFADLFTGFGRLVILEHGQGVFSLYGHLDALNVARGAQVEAGAVLGRSGRTPGGRDAVYFELRIDGRPVDPLQWLKPR
jgi:murein DD-endopeptidase MepM/ murein hydrolase activator NlpD